MAVWFTVMTHPTFILPPVSEDISAIEPWREALQAAEPTNGRILADIYRAFPPTQGELIFTGACSFQCAHCIYPPSFARNNRALEVGEWGTILQALERDVGIRTFVYGGRSLNADGVEVMAALRSRVPDAHIGMIDNGISMLPLLNDLRAVHADWFDVSLDGLAPDHDRQRRRPGSFAEGLSGAKRLKEEGFAPRVNILTCLTTLNYRSVCDMIRQVNALGFKNFFIVPITLGDGAGPAAELRLSRAQLAAFICELKSLVADLQDAWVELLLFSPDYAADFASALPDLWHAHAAGRDELFWNVNEICGTTNTANSLFIRYYPLSLTGVRELIVNTNGDVILPKSMVHGKVPQDAVLGNLLRESPGDLLAILPELQGFEFYRAELRKEAALLRSFVMGVANSGSVGRGKRFGVVDGRVRTDDNVANVQSDLQSDSTRPVQTVAGVRSKLETGGQHMSRPVTV
jgi:MoaA/NifB/PqqE/SkfB family radical SAM enzyme